MAYNIEDMRNADFRSGDHPRLAEAAAIIQDLLPDVLLVNEMTYDQPGAPGYRAGDPDGRNARRFADGYLSKAQADSLRPLSYQTVMLPVNTGRPSRLDLNNDRQVVTSVPDVPRSPADGGVAPQTAGGRAYGGDAWGFGTFPGQYGMALFVPEDWTVLRDSGERLLRPDGRSQCRPGRGRRLRQRHQPVAEAPPRPESPGSHCERPRTGGSGGPQQ